jgi:hypothetical protein
MSWRNGGLGGCRSLLGDTGSNHEEQKIKTVNNFHQDL